MSEGAAWRNVMRLTRFFSTLFVASVTVAACTEERAQPRTPSDALSSNVSLTETTNATVAAPAPFAQPVKSDQTVGVGPNLRQICGIDDHDRAPKFDFNEANLSGNDRDVLGQVAGCLTSGALQGRGVILVGRADPRGSEQYNINLGELRAQAVREYLIERGVDARTIREGSRGALDARGYDRSSWRMDRRVDIELE
jgi:peptidoglycan-associated lipoprotein